MWERGLKYRRQKATLVERIRISRSQSVRGTTANAAQNSVARPIPIEKQTKCFSTLKFYPLPVPDFFLII
jgi:hypothetical protein